MTAPRSDGGLTVDESHVFDEVGAGTLMGELLRRYWWPVLPSADLVDKPTFIRLLGEDLVVFRDGRGTVGVLAARCSHRGVNLCFGMTEAEGLRCRYHGWLYDTEGNVLETPGEPDDSFKATLKHPAYVASELGGAIWVYIGPAPVPLLPRHQFLVEGTPTWVCFGQLEHHGWLNGVENGMDPVHVTYLHGDVWAPVSLVPDDVRFEIAAEEDGTPWAVVYKAHRPKGAAGDQGTFAHGEQQENYRIRGIVFPAMSSGTRFLDDRGYAVFTGGRWSVPVDDTHTLHPIVMNTFGASFGDVGLAEEAPPPSRADAQWVEAEPWKEYREVQAGEPVTLGYDIPGTIYWEDGTMRRSMGGATARIRGEHLMPNTDVGVHQLRRLYLEQAQAVRDGRDPIGVVRDPGRNEAITIRFEKTWDF